MPKNSTIAAAITNIAAWMPVPVFAHGTTCRMLARRYSRNERNVDRIIKFTAVFLALGVMSAKNTAVNLMILSTFLSFLLYRRANIRQVVPWAKTGTGIQAAMFVIAAAIVLFFGIRGYFVEAIVRIGYSVYQVGAVLACIVFVTIIDVLMARGAQSLGAIQWGKMPPRSQYALFILAVTFTWLMGLMGFARSGIRQYWHVWQVMQDTSKYAATPALGYASKMISLCVLIFLSLVAFVFWLGGLAEKSTFVATGDAEKGARHVGH